MNNVLKSELEELIEAKEWSKLKTLANEKSNDFGGSSLVAIESIYQLLNLLSYGTYKNYAEHDEIAQTLYDIFENSFSKFHDDPEYLFFVGYCIALNDRYFKQGDLKLSHTLLRKAFDLEPDNLLYEWGFRFSTSDREARKVTEQIVNNDDISNTLRKKLSAGKFMVEAILNAERRFKSGRIEQDD
ncbi:MAG: hypothetical protein IPM63_13500 [Acidobacteriota bacterium]|nr:MAG: hypothetical protein IPM63_13500 [Acidobacteriota bacterium]